MKKIAVLILIVIFLSGCIGQLMTPWTDSKTYAQGDIAIADGVPWISLQGSNQDNFPPDCPDWWKE